MYNHYEDVKENDKQDTVDTRVQEIIDNYSVFKQAIIDATVDTLKDIDIHGFLQKSDMSYSEIAEEHFSAFEDNYLDKPCEERLVEKYTDIMQEVS